MKKLQLSRNLIGVGIALGVGAIIFGGCYFIGRDEVEEPVVMETSNVLSDSTEKVEVKQIDEYDIIFTMHEMANSITIADRERGYQQITPKRVNKLIVELESGDTAHKDRLLEILYRWKDGDFSEGVNDHNYVWKLLDGEIGRAHSLDMKEITTAVDNMK